MGLTINGGTTINGGVTLTSQMIVPGVSGVTIGTGELTYVTSPNISGNYYNYGGGYDYIVFTGDTTLENSLHNVLGITAGDPADFKPFAASWATGGNGYVFLEYTSDPLVQFYICDVDGNPLPPSSQTFPVTISRV